MGVYRGTPWKGNEVVAEYPDGHRITKDKYQHTFFHPGSCPQKKAHKLAGDYSFINNPNNVDWEKGLCGLKPS